MASGFRRRGSGHPAGKCHKRQSVIYLGLVVENSCGLLAHSPALPNKTALPLMEKPSRDESDRD